MMWLDSEELIWTLDNNNMPVLMEGQFPIDAESSQ